MIRFQVSTLVYGFELTFVGGRFAVARFGRGRVVFVVTVVAACRGERVHAGGRDGQHLLAFDLSLHSG